MQLSLSFYPSFALMVMVPAFFEHSNVKDVENHDLALHYIAIHEPCHKQAIELPTAVSYMERQRVSLPRCGKTQPFAYEA